MEEVIAPYEETFHCPCRMFLAGGITNCPDWQRDVCNYLSLYDDRLTVYNPRRQNFPIDDPNASQEQIKWETKHLCMANMICFWFSRGSLNPIALLEYGIWALGAPQDPLSKLIVVGVDPEYSRKKDVFIQTKFYNPHLPITTSFDDFLDSIHHEVYHSMIDTE